MTNFTPFLCDGTEISNMAAGGHSNMAVVGNNKIILRSPQNSLVIFTLSKGTYWLHSKPISEAVQYDLLTNTEPSKIADNWLQNLLITNNGLLDPVRFKIRAPLKGQ